MRIDPFPTSRTLSVVIGLDDFDAQSHPQITQMYTDSLKQFQFCF